MNLRSGKVEGRRYQLALQTPLIFTQTATHWRYNWSSLTEQARQFAQSQVPPYALASSDLPELVLMDDDHIIIPLTTVTKLWVHFLDYDLGGLTGSLLPSPPGFCVLLIAYTDQDHPLISSIHLRHCIPAEIELVELGPTRSIERFLA
jgi:hypothetical protein